MKTKIYEFDPVVYPFPLLVCKYIPGSTASEIAARYNKVLDRKTAQTLSVDEFKNVMSGIYSTTIGKGTIDESPMAYKPMDEIIRCIEPTAEIVDIIKPVYNFKAGE